MAGMESLRSVTQILRYNYKKSFHYFIKWKIRQQLSYTFLPNDTLLLDYDVKITIKTKKHHIRWFFLIIFDMDSAYLTVIYVQSHKNLEKDQVFPLISPTLT